MPFPRSCRRSIPLIWLVAACAALVPAVATAQPSVEYQLSFPSPVHHWAQVDVVFPAVPAGTLQVRMSRSSPGRYALHEFAKNVYDVHVFDGAGRELTADRPNAYEWDVPGHDGTVRVRYKIYGDHVDGTYLAIDTTHAHINMPATLMWARGLDARPVRVRFDLPQGLGWTVATQLFPTDDAVTFTAPNLQYLMDSPTELSAQTVRSFTVSNPDGRAFTIRAAIHHDATSVDVDQYLAGVRRIVEEEKGVFGEYPEYETGTYTFLADYLPWGGSDGMEHRNSTVVASPSSIRGAAASVLDAVAHEFFHCWNVERIRPKSLEPFNFEEANMSGELWLAEGFTQYYGELTLQRAGLADVEETVQSFGEMANAVVNGTGREYHNAVEMSELAPFTDAATAVDRTNLRNTFISYYTYGGAIALALDLTLRERSNGTQSLDDFMRAMWKVHGKPGGPQPGLVGHPYTMQDARDRLAEVTGDRAFADQFFNRFIEGREVAGYAQLFERAGILFRKRAPGAPWLGTVALDRSNRVVSLVDPDSPANAAGFDQDDVITSVDGRKLPEGGSLTEMIRGRKPGDRVTIAYIHPDGHTGSGVVTLAEDPSLEAVTVERTGGRPTAAQRALRDRWLGSTRR